MIVVTVGDQTTTFDLTAEDLLRMPEYFIPFARQSCAHIAYDAVAEDAIDRLLKELARHLADEHFERGGT